MHLVGVPTVYHDLLNDQGVRAEQLASLVRPRSGGAAVTERLRAQWLERFGHPLTSSLALTEAPTFVTREDPSGPRVDGSVGRAVGHVRITIVDDDGVALGPDAVGEDLRRSDGDGTLGRHLYPDARILGPTGGDRRSRCAARCCTPVTSADSMPMATSTWSAGAAR